MYMNTLTLVPCSPCRISELNCTEYPLVKKILYFLCLEKELTEWGKALLSEGLYPFKELITCLQSISPMLVFPHSH